MYTGFKNKSNIRQIAVQNLGGKRCTYPVETIDTIHTIHSIYNTIPPENPWAVWSTNAVVLAATTQTQCSSVHRSRMSSAKERKESHQIVVQNPQTGNGSTTWDFLVCFGWGEQSNTYVHSECRWQAKGICRVEPAYAVTFLEAQCVVVLVQHFDGHRFVVAVGVLEKKGEMVKTKQDFWVPVWVCSATETENSGKFFKSRHDEFWESGDIVQTTCNFVSEKCRVECLLTAASMEMEDCPFPITRTKRYLFANKDMPFTGLNLPFSSVSKPAPERNICFSLCEPRWSSRMAFPARDRSISK